MLNKNTHNNKICQEDFSNLLKKSFNVLLTRKIINDSYKFFYEKFLKDLKYVFDLIKPTKKEIIKLDSLRLGQKRNTYIIDRLIMAKINKKVRENKKDKALWNYYEASNIMQEIVGEFISISGNTKDGIKLYNAALMRVDFIAKNKVFDMKYREYCERNLKYHRAILKGIKKCILIKFLLNIIAINRYLQAVENNKIDVKKKIASKIEEHSNSIEDIKKKSQNNALYEEFYREKIERLRTKKHLYCKLLDDYRLKDDSINLIELIENPSTNTKKQQPRNFNTIFIPCIVLRSTKTTYRISLNPDCVEGIITTKKTLSNNYEAVIRFNENNTIESAFNLVGVSLNRKKYHAICPFHNDTNPSMHIFDNEKRAKCFACNAYVKSPFNAIEKIKNNKEEALAVIKDYYDIDHKPILKVKHDDKDRKRVPTAEQIKTNTEAQETYITNLEGDPIAQHYLYEIRKLTPECVEKFRLGSATTRENLLSIKIPHITEEGDIIGIISNIPESNPKYINSSYEKSYRPFGEFQTKGNHNSIIFTEGVYDCINAHAYGAINCVSNLGTGVTPEKMISYTKSRKAKKLILGFDNDEAGDRTTYSVIEYAHLNTIDIEISILDLKDSKDLDEYLKENDEMPKEISIIAYIFKKTYNSIESRKYLSEYGMKNYNGKNMLFNMFPFLKKINRVSIVDIITNFSNYLKSVEIEKKSEELRKRSIIWRESSYQDRDYKSQLEDSNILEFEILRRQNEETTRQIAINKYVKIRTCSLNLIIGDTGVGKTTFATHLAALNAEKDYKQLYISLEMDCGELFRKCFVFNEVYGRIPRKNITIIEERCSLEHIIEAIKTHKEKDKDLKIVYIDHLHLINVITDVKNLIPMDKIANDLLELARDLKIAIIGICQLTRESTKMFSAPQLHDIKNSSNLENNASVILGIHNPYLNTLRASRAICIEELTIEKRNKIRGKENCYILSVLKNRHDKIIESIEYMKIEVINEEKNIIEQMALFLLND